MAEATPSLSPLTFSNYACSAGTCTGSDSVGATGSYREFLIDLDLPKFDQTLGTITGMITP